MPSPGHPAAIPLTTRLFLSVARGASRRTAARGAVCRRVTCGGGSQRPPGGRSPYANVASNYRRSGTLDVSPDRDALCEAVRRLAEQAHRPEEPYGNVNPWNLPSWILWCYGYPLLFRQHVGGTQGFLQRFPSVALYR